MSESGDSRFGRHDSERPKPPRTAKRNRKPEGEVKFTVSEGDLVFRKTAKVPLMALNDERKGKVAVQAWRRPDEIRYTLAISELRASTDEEKTAHGWIPLVRD